MPAGLLENSGLRTARSWPLRRTNYDNTGDIKRSPAHCGDGWFSESCDDNDELGEWEFSKEDPTDESAWSLWART